MVDSSLAEEGLEFIGGAVDDEEGMMFVAVEDKQGSTGPFMAGDPKHCGPVELVEGIGGINLEEAEFSTVGMLAPELVGGMDATFDAGCEATAELGGAASDGGFFTSESDHYFGQEAAPDLANSYGADASIGFGEG